MAQALGQRAAPTRTPQTEQRYARAIERLRKAAQEAIKRGEADPAAPEIVRLAAVLLAREADWAAATIRVYRAALVWHAQKVESDDAQFALALLDRVDEDPEAAAQRKMALQQVRRERKMKQPRTSQQKARSVTPAQLQRLFAELHASNSIWAIATSEWFAAGMLTGLRPCEWRRAARTSKDGVTALRVENAKSTNGRSFGSHRTILLDGLSDWDLALIMRHLVRVQGHDAQDGYEKLFEGCRQLLRNVVDRILPKKCRHPTLYTARHIAAANAKSVLDRAGVAALMGHGSTDTAARHYAKRRQASGTLRVRPSQEDVEAVTRRAGPSAPNRDAKP